MRRHKVEVPGYIWIYFQQRYEVHNPASHMREALWEWVAEDMVRKLRCSRRSGRLMGSHEQIDATLETLHTTSKLIGPAFSYAWWPLGTRSDRSHIRSTRLTGVGYVEQGDPDA